MVNKAFLSKKSGTYRLSNYATREIKTICIHAHFDSSIFHRLFQIQIGKACENKNPLWTERMHFLFQNQINFLHQLDFFFYEKNDSFTRLEYLMFNEQFSHIERFYTCSLPALYAVSFVWLKILNGDLHFIVFSEVRNIYFLCSRSILKKLLTFVFSRRWSE